MYQKDVTEMDITCDLTQSQLYRSSLEEYLSNSVLSGKRFICAHFKECKSSHSGPFYQGQLHHVGDYYDISIDNRPFKIIVVGQSYGHKPRRVTMEERHDMIVEETGLKKRFSEDGYHKARNQHMRGTTSLLRLLFGIPLGSDYESEFIKINDNRVHLFETFALVNYLLCSAVENEDSSTDKSTRTMKTNCRVHFRNCLDILKPSIVVVQSLGYSNYVKKSLDKTTAYDNEGILYNATLGDSNFILAMFSHPSARNYHEYNWGADDHTPYLLDVVEPTTNKLRQGLLGIS